MSEEDLQQLRREVEQQEALLRGYQQENEAATLRIKVSRGGCTRQLYLYLHLHLCLYLYSTAGLCIHRLSAPCVFPCTTHHMLQLAVGLAATGGAVPMLQAWGLPSSPPPPPHTTHKHSSYPHSPTHPQELEQALAAAQAHAIQEVARLERAWAGVQEEGVSRGAEAAARLQRILDLEAALQGAR